MYNGLDSGQQIKTTMEGSQDVISNFMLDHNFTKPPSKSERPPAIGVEQGNRSADERSSVSGRSEVSNSTPRFVFFCVKVSRLTKL